MKLKSAILALTAASLGMAHADYFTGTASTGLWNSSRWNTSTDASPYSSAWAPGSNATFNAGTYTFTGGNSSGSFIVGNVTLALGGSSTYTGNTALYDGALQLTTGNDRLPAGTVVSLGQSASATLGKLDLNAFNQQIAGLSSTGGTNATAADNTVTSAAAATLTIHTAGSNSYSYGDGLPANSGAISGAISLVKSGAGTQILGDTNTYTGTTTINNGILAVNGSLAAGSAVTANSGGTLGGSGTVNGTVAVKSGGILAPGNSPGVLTTGATTFDLGSILSWELNSDVDHNGFAVDGTRGTNYDGLTATGLSVASGAVFRVVLTGTADLASGFWDQPQVWNDIFIGSGAATEAVAGHLFDTFEVYNGTTNVTSASATQGSFSFNGSTLTWSAIPEPTVSLAGLFLGACLLRRRREA